MTLLELRGVHKTFQSRRGLVEVVHRRPAPRLVALDDVSASVGRGRTLGIVGESGSGKSTLAKTIVRLVEPDAGSIRFRGEEIVSLSRSELQRIRRHIQLVYQDPYSSLNPRLTVREAILEPAKVHGLVEKDGEEHRLAELLEAVGLPAKIGGRRPRALSGGQRQRVAIARSLATEPEVLIADEVTSALDVSIQAQILNVFTELQREFGLTLVVISHDLPLVAHVADEVAVMYLGRIVEYGPTTQVFTRPAHPYTAALLAAQPSRDRRGHERVAVTGEIPSPLDIPTGCRFRTRCPLAEPICEEVDPPRVAVGAGHGSWCHILPARRGRATPPANLSVPADRNGGGEGRIETGNHASMSDDVVRPAVGGND